MTDSDTPRRRGFRLHGGDTPVTGPDGRVGAILRDDTRISLGPSSRIGIGKFIFRPAGEDRL